MKVCCQKLKNVKVPEGLTFKTQEMEKKGAYLVFDSASHGTLFLVWKNEEVNNALAFIKPAKPVPEFKFKHNNGKNELIRNLQSDNKRFYNGICQFLKEARDLKGDITLLKNIESKSPLKINVYYLKNYNVTQVKIDEPFKLEDVNAVCVVPKDSSALEVKTINKDLFVSKGNSEGAAISF